MNNEIGCEIEQCPQGIRDFLEIPMAGYDIPTSLYPSSPNDINENVEIREFGVGDGEVCRHHNRPNYQRHFRGHRYPQQNPVVMHHPVQVEPGHRRFACWIIGSLVVGTSFIILIIILVPLIVLL